MMMAGIVKKALYPSCMRLQRQYPPRALSKRNNSDSVVAENGPKVSIVVPSFNQAKYLEATLQSIFTQSYANLEVIVIDGGSTDSSVSILERYSNKLAYWESVPDDGQTNALNKGFARTTGEYLAWLNSDDLLMPNAIGRAVECLATWDNVDVVYGDRVIIDENSRDIGVWRSWNAHSSVLFYADFIPQETLFWKRSIWQRVGASLDESYQFAMDWDLLLRFKLSGAKFKKLDTYQGAFRFHKDQKTVCEIGSVGFNEMERLRRRCAKNLGLSMYSKREMRREIMHFMLKTRLKELAKPS